MAHSHYCWFFQPPPEMANSNSNMEVLARHEACITNR